MKINLSQAKARQGDKFEYITMIAVDSDILQTENIEVLAPCKFAGEYCMEDDVVRVSGECVVPLKCICSRCAANFEYMLKFDFDESFVRIDSVENEISDDDLTEFYTYSRGMLDLKEPIKDRIILETPKNIRCREDCKGICPHCYQDLNVGKCKCS